MQCLVKLEVEQHRTDAKLELISMSSALVPDGKPTFLEVIRYPMIRQLAKEQGKSVMLKVIFLLVKDFCSAVNVVRNMNEDQMIECASMLLDECDNFRLEDYVMMFHLGKRGQLIKIMDRLDIQVISSMLDEYWLRRKRAGERYQEEECRHFDTIGNPIKSIEQMHPLDVKLHESANGYLGAIDQMKQQMTEWKNQGSAGDELNGMLEQGPY